MKYFSVKQIAALYGVHTKTVRNWLRDGKVEGVRLPGSWRVCDQALQVFDFLKPEDSEKDEVHDRGL